MLQNDTFIKPNNIFKIKNCLKITRKGELVEESAREGTADSELSKRYFFFNTSIFSPDWNIYKYI